jgi:hypothetical protein
MKFYTYIHRSATDGSIFYIGKGSGKRAWNFNHRSKTWKEFVASHGVIVDIAAYWDLEKDSLSHECLLIECMKDLGIKLCNLAKGGTQGPTGYRFTEEQRKALSLQRKGYKHSEETKRKISIGQQGRIGNLWTEEQRLAASASRKGRPGRQKSQEELLKLSLNNGSRRQDVRDKIASSLKGRKSTQETRVKQSIATKGVPKPPEHKEKIRVARLAYFQRQREQFGFAQKISDAHKKALRDGYNKHFGISHADN